MMKPLLAALTLALSACASAMPPSMESRAASEAEAIVLGYRHNLASAVLGEAREVNVWLPPDYEQGERRYNVLYVLDGGLDQDFVHIAGLGQLGALSWTYEPLIVVGVRTNDRVHDLTPPPRDRRYVQDFPSAGGAGDFRRYLETEIMPFIASRYRTGERSVLIGESLAGYFVIDTLINQPALFSDYIAVSPSMWWDDRALAANPTRLRDLRRRRSGHRERRRHDAGGGPLRGPRRDWRRR